MWNWFIEISLFSEKHLLFSCRSREILNYFKFIFNFSLDGNKSGLDEEEMAASVATLQSLASTLPADCVLIRERKTDNGLLSEYLVRRQADEKDFMEVRLVWLCYVTCRIQTKK